MSKRINVSQLVAYLNDIPVSTVCDIVEGVISDCRKLAFPANSRVTAFHTVGDVHNHKSLETDDDLLAHLVDGALGSITRLSTNTFGFEVTDLSPEQVFRALNATQKLLDPAISEMKRRLASTINN